VCLECDVLETWNKDAYHSPWPWPVIQGLPLQGVGPHPSPAPIADRPGAWSSIPGLVLRTAAMVLVIPMGLWGRRSTYTVALRSYLPVEEGRTQTWL
jgi:hypothetical protein